MTLNREFYSDHGRDFSETRRRLQPGVTRLLDSLCEAQSILDLGCGNGELARALSRRGYRGSYLGLDFSPSLLEEARREPLRFSARFQLVDIAQLLPAGDPHLATADRGTRITDRWSRITAFAVLHHIPSRELRLGLITAVGKLLRSDGLFVHSNWRFLDSPRLRARIQAWENVGLTSQDVDRNDHLLDWKRGGQGLRYVHYFDEGELAELASASGFNVVRTFYSDGENGKLGLYELWKKSGGQEQEQELASQNPVGPW